MEEDRAIEEGVEMDMWTSMGWRWKMSGWVGGDWARAIALGV